MRVLTLLLALSGPGSAAALAAGAPDPQALEQAWHACLREAITHQPAGQSRAGNERNALDECRDRENAYVAALMDDRPATGWTRTWTLTWTRTWKAIVEPLYAWADPRQRRD